jgi:hypothetical protein
MKDELALQTSGVTTAPADSATQGGPQGLEGPFELKKKNFHHHIVVGSGLTHCHASSLFCAVVSRACRRTDEARG